jgi:hypothetical protein
MMAIFTGFVFAGLLQMLTGADAFDTSRRVVVRLLTASMVLLTFAMMCFHATAHAVLRYWRIFYPVSIFNHVGGLLLGCGLVTMYGSISALLWIKGFQVAAILVLFASIELVLFAERFRSMHKGGGHLVPIDGPPAAPTPAVDKTDLTENKTFVAASAGVLPENCEYPKTKNDPINKPFDDQEKVRILLHEYDTLRQEIITRTTHGWQIVAVGAVLFVWLIQAQPNFNFWVGFIAVVFAILLGVWTTFGNIAMAAKRVRGIEKQINLRAGEELLVWETRHGGGLTGFVRRIRPSTKQCGNSNQLAADKNDREEK